MMKKNLIAVSLMTVLISGVEASEWKVSFGDSGLDFHSVERTKDGGYILAGEDSRKFAAAKIDADGSLEWMKRYDQYYLDSQNTWVPSVIRQTKDGGYFLGGTTETVGENGHYYPEGWLARLDRDGTIRWQRHYGGKLWDYFTSFRETKDGGAVVVGAKIVRRKSGTTDYDAWVLKLKRSGRIEWQKGYSSKTVDEYNNVHYYNDFFQAVEETKDGGYIVAGNTSWPHGSGGAWIMKLDGIGSIEWQERFQDYYHDSEGHIHYNYSNIFSVQQTRDGGYIFAGVGAFKDEIDSDFWIVKLDENGGVQWQKRYGCPSQDTAYVIRQTKDGGYLVAGNRASYYSQILKLDSDGKVLWQKDYNIDHGGIPSLALDRDGGFVFAGRYEVAKADQNGNIPGCYKVGETNCSKAGEVTGVAGRATDASAHDLNAPGRRTDAATEDLHPTLYQRCYANLRLLNPNGGILSAGLPKILRWSADFAGDSQTLPSSFGLKYSLDKGRHWKKITAGLDNDTRRYRWRVPAQWHDLPRRALVRVDAFDDLDRLVSDRSDRPLTLRIAKLLAPNKRVTLKSGEKYTIRWHIGAKGKIGKMILQLSTDNGKHWKRIKIVAKPKVRSWRWTVPHTPSNRCRIRVIVKNAKGKTIGVDVSDRTFRIE